MRWCYIPPVIDTLTFLRLTVGPYLGGGLAGQRPRLLQQVPIGTEDDSHVLVLDHYVQSVATGMNSGVNWKTDGFLLSV